VIRCWLLKTQS